MTSNANILYRFYDNNGCLLYIGITNDPWRRFSQHRSDKQWWPEVANICQQSFATNEELRDAEKRAIASENPRYNKLFASQFDEVSEKLEKPKSGLAGMFFHSWTEPSGFQHEIVRNGLSVLLQGQVINQISSETFLVDLFSWWDGCKTESRLFNVSEMGEWTFYETNIDMKVQLGCGEFVYDETVRNRGRCGKTVVGIVGLEYGYESAVCGSCAQHYGEVSPISEAKKEQVWLSGYYFDTAIGEWRSDRRRRSRAASRRQKRGERL